MAPGFDEALNADVVVCVHNATEVVRRCLASIVTHTDLRHGLILVDDASGPECRGELEQFAASYPVASLLRNEERCGYTQSANRGLRESRSAFVVLLNSDTIVTPGWLERLLECAESDPRIGIIGPLSNAATFQSVPKRYDEDDRWALNPLPPPWGPGDMAALIAAIAPRAFPRVGLINGFCFGIKRALIDSIGYFDEEAFPDGYGEEEDYCLRSAKAGFALAIADHAYVYHAWNTSYGHERREVLKQAAQATMLRRHKVKRIRAAVAKTYYDPTLAAMRKEVAGCLRQTTPLQVPT
jgi:GT2 family glycosyltransferase